jgi:hypothetical protein
MTFAGDSTEISVDTPGDGQTVDQSQDLVITGWAADDLGLGTGVDTVHIYANGPAGGGGSILGAASYGTPRPDVVYVNGMPGWLNSGFNFTSNASGLAPGPHTLYVYAHSTATGDWSYRTVGINVLAAQPVAPVLYTGGGAVAPPTATNPYGGCPAGYFPAGSTCYTPGDANGSCSGGYLLLNGTCTRGRDTCTGDYAPRGNQCAYVGVGGCPDGYVSNGVQCVYSGGCPAGYAYQAASCVPTTTSSAAGGPAYQAGSSGCQPGYMYQNGSCVYTGGGAYPASTYSAGACPAGYFNSNGQCVSTAGASGCPAGYVNVNNSCQFVGRGGCTGYSNYYNPYANC